MDAAKLKKILTDALSVDKVETLARALGAKERQSKVRLTELVIAIVLTVRTSGRQADAFKFYKDLLKQHELVRATLYSRFDPEFEKLMHALLEDALDAVVEDEILLPPAIAGVIDWIVRDSTTVQLHDALRALYPSTDDGAALKVHKSYSIGRQNLVAYQLSPSREHDSRYMAVREELRGHGLLVDLGYASHQFITDCHAHDVKFVMKLKSGWKVRVENVAQAELEEALADGPFDLMEALANYNLRPHEGVIDADVSLLIRGRRHPLRLVVLEVEGKNTCLFLTNLPRERYPASVVGDLYRLRWDIEKDNKLNKTDWQLDELDGRKAASVHAMLYASLLGSTITNRIVHQDHVELARRTEPMTRGALHARLVALCLFATHGRLVEALSSRAGEEGYAASAGLIDHEGRDPNWRRRPSVLDRLFGFTAAPGRPRRQKAITRPPGGDRSGDAN